MEPDILSKIIEDIKTMGGSFLFDKPILPQRPMLETKGFDDKEETIRLSMRTIQRQYPEMSMETAKKIAHI